MKKELLFYFVLAMGASIYLNAQASQHTQEHLSVAKQRIEQAANARINTLQFATVDLKTSHEEGNQIQ